MTCASCIHFSARAASDATIEPAKTDLSTVGVCRRYPPRMEARPNFLASLFPNVHRSNSCGEYGCVVPL
ncbi:hypothetical protein [uncultured Sphingomonas sp.]|uniref:hypothetical protein n=1 Tax=uncultured Sphingomonas sp. TaxID=158754 RepID=UPI0025DF5B0A|nr:hypothetical protein [uncultured Sphingomonas sp.]